MLNFFKTVVKLKKLFEREQKMILLNHFYLIKMLDFLINVMIIIMVYTFSVKFIMKFLQLPNQLK